MYAGVASDALKVAEYREVLRMRREIKARNPGAFNFTRQLGSGMSPYTNFSRILSKVLRLAPLAVPNRPAIANFSSHIICLWPA